MQVGEPVVAPGSDKKTPAIPMLNLEAHLNEESEHPGYDRTYQITLPKSGDAEITLTKSKAGFFPHRLLIRSFWTSPLHSW